MFLILADRYEYRTSEHVQDSTAFWIVYVDFETIDYYLSPELTIQDIKQPNLDNTFS